MKTIKEICNETKTHVNNIYKTSPVYLHIYNCVIRSEYVMFEYVYGDSTKTVCIDLTDFKEWSVKRMTVEVIKWFNTLNSGTTEFNCGKELAMGHNTVCEDDGWVKGEVLDKCVNCLNRHQCWPHLDWETVELAFTTDKGKTVKDLYYRLSKFMRSGEGDLPIEFLDKITGEPVSCNLAVDKTVFSLKVI